MKNRKINVLKLTAGNNVEVVLSQIEDELKNYQDFVEGNIECVRIKKNLIMIVNDEGLIRKLPENIIATFLYWSIHGKAVTPICGNVILAGLDPENEEFCNIPIGEAMQIVYLSRKLRDMETSEDPGARPE